MSYFNLWCYYIFIDNQLKLNVINKMYFLLAVVFELLRIDLEPLKDKGGLSLKNNAHPCVVIAQPRSSIQHELKHDSHRLSRSH